MLLPMKQGRPTTKPRTVFGQRLADARERAGLTQQQLAERLGTSQRALARWERDPVALRPDQLAILTETLGVTADYLLGRPSAKQPATKGPTGKVRQVFERVNQLPRHQQHKVVEFVEAFIDHQASK